MKKIYKIKNYKLRFHYTILTCFVFVTLFMGLGYAQMSETDLIITGKVNTVVQDGIFISNVSYNEDKNANLENSKIIGYYQTMLNSSIELSPIDGESYIKYNISVYNNSEYDYTFQGITYEEELKKTYTNNNIIYEYNGIEIGEVIAKKQTKTFTIIFKYKDGKILNNSIEKYNILDSYLMISFEADYENANVLGNISEVIVNQ